MQIRFELGWNAGAFQPRAPENRLDAISGPTASVEKRQSSGNLSEVWRFGNEKRTLLADARDLEAAPSW